MKSERGNSLYRMLDRVLGVPLLMLAALFHRKRALPSPDSIRQIGFVMLGAIGDAVLAGAVLADVRGRYPGAVITVFSTSANRGIIELLAGVDVQIVLSLSQPWRAVAAMRRTSFDLLVDFSPWPRIGALLTAAAKTRYTAGFHTKGQARHFAYDGIACHSSDRHELENLRALSVLLDVTPHAVPELRRAGPKFHLPAEKNWIGLHPWPAGFRSTFREWRLENWVELSNILIARGFGLCITGGPADVARAKVLAGAIATTDHVMNVSGRASLSDTVAILDQLAALVCVNTGITHMAAALDCPQVTLHGPTNMLRWGPVSAKAIMLGPGPDQGCAYLDLGFEYPPNPPDCMGKITVADVLSALERALPMRGVP